MRRRIMVVVAAAALLVGCASSHPKSADTPGTPAPKSIYVRTPGGGSVAIAGVTGTSNGATAITIPVPLDRSWKALSAAYGNLGITVAAADPASHTLGNHQVELRRKLKSERLSSFLDCGTGLDGYPHADEYAVTLDLVTQLTAADNDGTTVRTLVSATATPVSGLASDPVQCVSNGTLEQRIAKLVQADAAN